MSTRTFAAFSCTHCPLENPKAIDWLLGRLSVEQPDYVIHLGDLFEADASSRWPSEADWDFEDELRAADQLMERIAFETPFASHILLHGNHDHALIAPNRLSKKIRGLVDWRRPQFDKHNHQLNASLLKWKQPCVYEYSRTRGCFRLGPVTFAHGYECRQGSDEAQALLLGVPFGLTVLGHTHRPVDVTQARKGTIKLPAFYCNVGTLRRFQGNDCPDYVQRSRHDEWGAGLVFGETTLTKSPRMSARAWDAHLEVFEVADPVLHGRRGR